MSWWGSGMRSMRGMSGYAWYEVVRVWYSLYEEVKAWYAWYAKFGGGALRNINVCGPSFVMMIITHYEPMF